MNDPNLYALSVSLSLDSGAAFNTLDEFSDRVLRIEGEVADAGKAAVSDIDKTIQATEENLSRVIAQIKEIDTAGTKGFEFAKDAFNNFSDIEEICQKELDWLDEYQKGFEELVDHTQEITKSSAQELKSLDLLTKRFEGIIALIDRKNKGHQDELDLVSREQRVTDELGNSWKNNNKHTSKSQHSHLKLLGTLHDIWGMIRAIDEETENFITTNFRAYGSQYDLLQATHSLTMEFGIFRGAAIEAYKVLGNLKIPADQLRQYAKAVAMASRYTGVGVADLGQFAFRMRQVGFDATKTERQLNFAGEAMRKFGLDTTDISRILQGTSLSAAELNRIFGKGSTEKFLEMTTVVTGLAKQMGFASDQAMAFFRGLDDPIARAKFEVFAGHGIETMGDFEVAVGKAATASAAKLAELREMYGDNSKAIQIAAKTWAEASGIGTHANMEMLASLDEIAKRMKIDIQTEAGWAAVKAELHRRSMDQYDEANKGLTAQLRILRDLLTSVVSSAIMPLNEALAEVVKWINTVVKYLIGMGKAVSDWWTGIVNIFPELKALTYWLKLGAAAILILGGSIIVLGGIFGLIPGIMGLVTRGIVGLFRAVGLGVQAFGRAVSSVMVPLLALGFTFLMVGAGVYLLAEAFKVFTTDGWSTLGMLAAFAGGILVFGLLLVGLGYLAQGAAIGLAILAGVFLAIGLSALMVGYGMKLFAQGIDIIAVSGMAAVKPLFYLAGAMLALGVAGYIAGPGLMLMAIGMWLLAPAILLVGAGMMMLAASIKAVNFSAVMESGKALLAAAAIYAVAGIALIAAGVSLAVGAATTLAASLALAAGSVVLLAAGTLLAVAAVAVGIGSFGMMLSGIMLAIGSGLIIAASGLLTLAGGYLVASTAGLVGAMFAIALVGVAGIAAGVALGSAAFLLGAASIAIGIAGVGLSVAGMTVAVGGALLMAGAVLVSGSSGLLAAAAGVLGPVALGIGGSVGGLLSAGTTMVLAGGALLAGALALAPAAIAIRASVWVMSGAVNKLAAITPKLSEFASGINSVAGSLDIIRQVREVAPTLQAFAASTMLLVGSLSALQALPTDTLTEIATNSLEALPGLTQFVTEFEAVANKLHKTAESVVASTENINAAIAKTSPALTSISRAAIADVRSEAIQTVQIMDKREGSISDNRTEVAAMATLDTLKQILAALAPLDSNQIAAIRDLLEQRLPTGEPTGGHFASGLSSWRR